MTGIAPEHERLFQRLARLRARARAVILFERVWPAIWPSLGAAGAFVIAALLGLPRLLPPLAHLALLLLTLGGIVWLAWRSLRRVSRPDDATADRRLELDSGLRHRPLAAVADRPALPPDGEGEALWRAHMARAIGQLSRLRVGLPRPGMAARDPRALRAGLLVALAASLVIAGGDAPARLVEALTPALPAAPPPPAIQLQGWITPPAYTHLAPVFLRADGGAVSVPTGSHLTVSLTGSDQPSPPTLVLDAISEPFRPLDQASFQADLDLSGSGRVSVRRDGRELAAWDLTVIPKRAPVVSWTSPPGRARQGTQTRLPWQADDAYGVMDLRAELRLKSRLQAAPLPVPIPLPGGTPKSAHGVSTQDFTAHPWAGLLVVAKLIGHNAPGLSGESEEAEFTLPERTFRHPVARALIAIRKQLSIDPDDRPAALARLDELLLTAPEALAGDLGAFVNLEAIYYRLVREHGPEAVEDAQARMWSLAVHLEEGAAERTAKALEQAREAARDALEQARRDPSEANNQVLDQRLKELEDALQRHMEALAERARREMSEAPDFDPNQARLDSKKMKELADQARDAAREGRMDDAREKMAELEQMLDQLRDARPEHGQSDPKRAEQRQRGRQQMGALQDMIGREGKLLDHAESRAQAQESKGSNQSRWNPQAQPQQGQAQQGQAQQGQNQQGSQRQADRRVQQALRRALGELMQQFGDLTGEIPSSLSEADTAMRDAAEAMAQGRDPAAGAAAQRAIEALQKGGQAMGQAMARQFGPGEQGEGGEQDGDGQGGAAGLSQQEGQGEQRGDGFGSPRGSPPGRNAHGDRRDPLGRQLGRGAGGDDGEDATKVPGAMEQLRTQAIQEELRRRDGERNRPRQELDYIERLLKQF